MPNCDYYGFGEDHRLVLEYLLDQNCEVYDLASDPGEKVTKFSAISDFKERFGFSNWDKIGRTIHLQIWPKDAGGSVTKKKVSLKYVSEPTKAFRYRTEGWGLIQLYLESPIDDILRPSHTNHNSEKRAMKWSSTYSEMGAPEEWDWKFVNSFSRKLNHFIRKSAVEKRGSRAFLPSAAAQFESGTILPSYEFDRQPT